MKNIKTIALPEFGSREKHFEETGEYPGGSVDLQQEAILIEYEHFVPLFAEQLTMPAVTDGDCGEIILLAFQRCLGGFLEVLIREELITPQFCEKYSKFLDPEFGIRRDVRMNIMELYNAFYDLETMMFHFSYACGECDENEYNWEDWKNRRQSDFYYNNSQFFGLAEDCKPST